MLVPGSITFLKPNGPVDLSNPMAWCRSGLREHSGDESRGPDDARRKGYTIRLLRSPSRMRTPTPAGQARNFQPAAGARRPRGHRERRVCLGRRDRTGGGIGKDESLDRRVPLEIPADQAAPGNRGPSQSEASNRTLRALLRSPGTPGNGRGHGLPTVVPSRPAVAARQPIRSVPGWKPVGSSQWHLPKGPQGWILPLCRELLSTSAFLEDPGEHQVPTVHISFRWRNRPPGRPGRVKPVRGSIQGPRQYGNGGFMSETSGSRLPEGQRPGHHGFVSAGIMLMLVCVQRDRGLAA